MKLLNRIAISAFAFALLGVSAHAQSKGSNVLDLKYSIQDSNIVFPESFETGSQKLMERWYLKNYTSADLDGSPGYDPGATDREMKQRLAALPTIIEMPYNDIVKTYIEHFTKNGRKQVSALLGLSSYYMPIFEQALEENGLPLELKYLPVIESGLDPTATSKHGAAGLWQFIIASARGYDMEVSSLVDERRDPYVSTDRACRMLKDLYDTYGDWSLAIAAYNCGPGTLNKALNRAGGTPDTHDFWSIYYYLPEETRGYVPMFIAANYVMNYYPEHNISPVLATKPLITDTVHLSERVHFNQIAAILDIPLEELRILNPQFRADVIPATPEKTYNLILPSQQMHAFLVSQDQIMDYEREKYAQRTEATPGGDPTATPVEPETSGEPLNPADPAPVEMAAAEVIYEEVQQETTTPRRRRNQPTTAQTSATTAQQTAAATETSSQQETPKQASSNKKAETTKQTASKTTTTKKETKPKTSTHTVASGENLTVIAKKYGVTVDDLRKANTSIKGDKIKAGEKITIPAKTTAKKKSKKR